MTEVYENRLNYDNKTGHWIRITSNPFILKILRKSDGATMDEVVLKHAKNQDLVALSMHPTDGLCISINKNGVKITDDLSLQEAGKHSATIRAAIKRIRSLLELHRVKYNSAESEAIRLFTNEHLRLFERKS